MCVAAIINVLALLAAILSILALASSLEVVTPPVDSLPDSPVTPPIGGVSAASSLALKYGG